MHKLMQIWLTFKCTSSDAQARPRTHTHTWGRELSAITAQWNIFRLERCRITLQPDDKYAVSTIINLVPLPTFRLQTPWCKGRGAGIHWMELVPQLGLRQCSWCMRWAGALPCSTRSRKHKRSRHSDSLSLLLMSPFRKAGGWVKLRSCWFFIPSLLQWKIQTNPHLLHTLSQAVHTLLFPLPSPLFPFATASSFFSFSTLLPAATLPYFIPKVSLTYCPEWHFVVSGHCLANEKHAYTTRGLRRQW